MQRHDIVCVHTMVGYLGSTDTYFRKTNGTGYVGTESHYGIGGNWGSDRSSKLDGVVYQWQGREYSADANGEGGPRVISIETADNAPARASSLAPWSPAQVNALINLIAWECSYAAHRACPKTWTCHKGTVWNGVRVAIPPAMIHDTRSTARGLAVHRQGIEHSLGVGKVAGWLRPGCERWSTARGKECPGDARIAQFRGIIIPAVQARLIPEPKPVARTAPPPAPSLEIGDEMVIVGSTDKSDPKRWVLDSSGRRHIPNKAAYDDLVKAGIRVLDPLTPATLKMFPEHSEVKA
jgi:hypothetical protein